MLSPGETSERKIHDTENGEIKKCHANGHEKNLGQQTEKPDFQTRFITRDKEGQYIILKGVVNEKIYPL